MKLMLPALLLSLSLGAFAQDDDELLDVATEGETPEVFVPSHPWEKPIFHRVLLGYTGTFAKYTNDSPTRPQRVPFSEEYFLSGVNLGWMADIRLMKKNPFYIEVGTMLSYHTGRSKNDSLYVYHSIRGSGEEKTLHYRIHAFTLTVPVNLTYQFKDIANVQGLTLAPFAGAYARFNLIAHRTETVDVTTFENGNDGKGVPVGTFTTRQTKSLRVDNNNGRDGWMEGRSHIGKLVQIGVQGGVNAYYKRFSLGISYMYDILPFAEHSSPAEITYKDKSAGEGRDNQAGTGCDMKATTSHNFAITAGYFF